jgi:hypothetical protein
VAEALYGDAMAGITADIQSMAERANGDVGLIRRGRFVDLEFMLQIGDQGHYIRIDKGRLTSVTPSPLLLRPWTFAIHIDAAAWPQFCQKMPRPGYHDIFAMCKLGVARIDGDINPFMANLRYFKEVLAKATSSTSSAAASAKEAAHGR